MTEVTPDEEHVLYADPADQVPIGMTQRHDW